MHENRSEHNSLMAWHGVKKLQHAESANNVSKWNEARKETLGHCSTMRCHDTFLHQNLIWSFLEMLTRAGIVSPRTSQRFFHIGNRDCHHPKCCPHLERRCVSWAMRWHVISPKDCTQCKLFGKKTMVAKHSSDIPAFLGGERGRRCQRSCQIPTSEKTRGRTAQNEHLSSVTSICHPALRQQSSHNTLVTS